MTQHRSEPMAGQSQMNNTGPSLISPSSKGENQQKPEAIRRSSEVALANAAVSESVRDELHDNLTSARSGIPPISNNVV